MIKAIYCVVGIIGFASTALALRCHTCSSLQSPDCGEPFKGGSRYETDCNTSPANALGAFLPNINLNPTGCLKSKMAIIEGVDILTRSCYFGEIRGACERNTNQISCSICTGDLCNSSTTTGAFAAIIMLFAVLVRMMS